MSCHCKLVMEVLYAGVSGIFLLSVHQNIVAEPGVHNVDLNPGKGISKQVLFSVDVTERAWVTSVNVA